MKSIDIFGHQINLQVNKKYFIQSIIGGIFTIFTIIIIISFTWLIGRDIILKETPISYIQTDIMGKYPPLEISNKNFPFSFTLTDDDNVPLLEFSFLKMKLYYIQYAMDYETQLYTLKSKTDFSLKFCELSDFPTINEEAFIEAQLGYSLCPVNFTFLLEGYWTQDSLSHIQISIEKCKNENNNRTEELSHLILDNKILKIMYDNFDLYNPNKTQEISQANDSSLINNQIKGSQNFTNTNPKNNIDNISGINHGLEHDYNCKTDDEIEYFISKSGVNLNLFYVSTKVSISNNTHPIEQVTGSSYKYLLFDVFKKSVFKIQKQYISTDNGLIFSTEEKIDFSKIVDEQTDSRLVDSDNPQILAFDIFSSNISDIYFRRYIKLPDIIASLGGLWKIFYMSFMLFSKYFSEVEKNISIINEIFVLNKIKEYDHKEKIFHNKTKFSLSHKKRKNSLMFDKIPKRE